MASSSSNVNALKKHFNHNFNGDSTEKTIDSLIEWLKKMDVFKALNIVEDDFRKACKKIKEKAVITFEDFQKILEELARQSKKDFEEMKRELVEIMDVFEKADISFREELKKGEASVESAVEWLKKNLVLEKVKLVEEEVAKELNKAKKKATIDYDSFVKGMKEVAKKNELEIEKFLSSFLDPGFLPKIEESGSVDKKKK